MTNEKIHIDAMLGAVPQLNVFESPIVQSGVERAKFVEYRPTSQISSQDAPVHFTLGGDSANYVDFRRTRLYMKLKIVQSDGSILEEDQLPAPINYTLNSLWSQIEVKLSGKTVSMSNNLYMYKSYIQAVVKCSEQAKMTHMAAQMYRQDDGEIEKVVGNAGAAWRGQRFVKSASVEIEGPLKEDILNTDRYILNNTQIDIKLFRARQPFVIMTDDDKEYKIIIEDICLKVCYIDVHPGIIAGHAAALQKANAIYPYTRVEMLTFNLSSGSRQFTLDNLFNNQCPTKVLVCFVDSEAFSGSYKKNPFNFQNFGLTEIEMTSDGQVVPGRGYKIPEFNTLGSQVVSPYMRLFDTINPPNLSLFGNGIDPEDFARGFAIYAFPIYGGGAESNFMQMKKSSNVRIQGNFNGPLSSAVTVVIYAEFPAIMEIDAARNITVT